MMTFNELHSPNPLTLESVKTQLDHWRTTRVKGARIPKHLWEALKSLTKHYSYSQIASELKINSHRLRAKIEDEQSKQTDSPSSNNFIELPLSHLAPPLPHPPSPWQKTSQSHAQGILELTRPDGIALKASGLNQKDLCSFIKSFLGQ